MKSARKIDRSRKKKDETETLQQEAARVEAEREAEIAQREAKRIADEEKREAAVQERLERLRIEHEARKLHIQEVTRQRPFPIPEVGWTAADFLEETDEPPQPVVDTLHFQGNNTLLVAEHKTGKTTLEVALAASLVDDKPFLGKFDMDFPAGRVAFFNYEMTAAMFRDWLNDSEIENIDRIIPLNLRGWQLPFWEEGTMLELSEWLLKNEVGFIILDPLSKASRGIVETEGDNVQLAEFFGSLDELKRLGNCPNLIISAHKPRAKEDRARGGGEIEAWPDGNWYLNKNKEGVRSIRAEGRDVLLDEIDLEFNTETRKLTAGSLTSESQLIAAADAAVETLKAHGEFPSITTFCDSIKGVATGMKRKGIRAAVEEGRIVEQRDGRSKSFQLAEG